MGYFDRVHIMSTIKTNNTQGNLTNALAKTKTVLWICRPLDQCFIMLHYFTFRFSKCDELVAILTLFVTQAFDCYGGDKTTRVLLGEDAYL